MTALLAIGFTSCAMPAAAAAPWETDSLRSKLTFTAQQGEEQFTGGFRNFSVMIDFDAKNLEHSKIEAAIDMASAYAGSQDRDDALPGTDWFNVASFPQAKFSSDKIYAVKASNSYIAEGRLTIRNITKPISLKFALTPESNYVHAQGSVEIMRNDFGVGQGDFVSDAWIKYGVIVSYDIYAKRKFNK